MKCNYFKTCIRHFLLVQKNFNRVLFLRFFLLLIWAFQEFNLYTQYALKSSSTKKLPLTWQSFKRETCVNMKNVWNTWNFYLRPCTFLNVKLQSKKRKFNFDGITPSPPCKRKDINLVANTRLLPRYNRLYFSSNCIKFLTDLEERK